MSAKLVRLTVSPAAPEKDYRCDKFGSLQPDVLGLLNFTFQDQHRLGFFSSQKCVYFIAVPTAFRGDRMI